MRSPMNDISFIKNYKHNNFRYTQKTIPIIRNGTMKVFSLIMLENLVTKNTVVSEYNEMLLSKRFINKSVNTIKDTYGIAIVMFLNYIFFERKSTLNSIEEISVSIGNEFLNRYTYGQIGNSTTKTDDSIKKISGALTAFYNWLHKSKKYKMKNLHQEDFNIKSLSIHNKKIFQSPVIVNKEYIESPFTIELPNVTKNKKLENPSEFLIFNLIETAKLYDPLMAFPIAIQAFLGLRIGEVCQLSRDRISIIAPYGTVVTFTLNLLENKMLRADGKSTGEIKRKRVQIAYEAFLPMIETLYKAHLKLLHDYEFDNNEFGALVVDSKGNAILKPTYRKRFHNLVLKLIERVMKMAKNNHFQATIDIQLLLNYYMTPHSLRYFFSQYVGKYENSHTLAMYRGDKNINTALTYLKDSPYRKEYISKLQNSFIENYMKSVESEVLY